MQAKHKKTLEAIFAKPVRAGIPWKNIESLFVALGAELETGRNGSRVFVLLNEEKAVFHRPHPGKDTDKGAVVSVRGFLMRAGITP